MKKSVPFEAHHAEFLADPVRASSYLSVALETYAQDQDTNAFLLALRDVAEAQGGLGKLAERTKLNRGHIYRTLSSEGNPRLDTIGKILNSLGFRLSIEKLGKRKVG